MENLYDKLTITLGLKFPEDVLPLIGGICVGVEATTYIKAGVVSDSSIAVL